MNQETNETEIPKEPETEQVPDPEEPQPEEKAADEVRTKEQEHEKFLELKGFIENEATENQLNSLASAIGARFDAVKKESKSGCGLKINK